MDFLRVIKFRSTSSFRWEVKPEVPCRKILRHVKELLKSHRDGQTKFSFPLPILLLAPEDVSADRTAREYWWLPESYSRQVRS
jgi:hypothetical protein